MSRIQIDERRVGDVTGPDAHRTELCWMQGDAPMRERIDALVQEGRVDIILNLQNVNDIDSCGVGSVVAKFLSVRRRGGDLKLVCLSERGPHVLEITGRIRILAPLDSEEEALRKFAVGA